jgi:hypothetical protein
MVRAAGRFGRRCSWCRAIVHAPPDLVISEDRTTSTLAPQAVSDTFYNTAGADWVSRAAAPVGPEPMATWVTSLALSEGRFG